MMKKIKLKLYKTKTLQLNHFQKKVLKKYYGGNKQHPLQRKTTNKNQYQYLLNIENHNRKKP